MNANTQAAILSINAGSSSLKFALYPLNADRPGRVSPAWLTGEAQGLEPHGEPVLQWRMCGTGERHTAPIDGAGGPADAGSDPFDRALAAIRDALRSQAAHIEVRAVAHRIVHGGDRYVESVWLDDAAMRYLATLAPLAPLHQPHNLAGVAALRRAFPALPQLGCFDTAFHASLPDVERLFALPRALLDQGIRRYGFHGLSYRYLTGVLTERSPLARGRMLLAHLGNGASLCAVKGGASVATTMGFSAVDGLMMGTRCGALDPAVVLHLLRQGSSVDEVERLINQESGLLGVSGLSADMRTLRASGQPHAAQAIALFTHRVVRECGAMAACLGGVDVLAFTGGIGEHDHVLREQVALGLSHLGVKLDASANARANGDETMAVQAADSAAEIWVVPTDEGRVAAGDAASLLDAA